METDTRRWPPLVVAGLTGGIASGKSTVAALFAELGAVVLNADDEGRACVQDGEPALAEVVAAFGPEFLREDGALDRAALATRIFASRADRETLNRITHPRIAQQLGAKLAALARRPPPSRIVVVEAAVLVEAGWTALVDRIIVVMSEHSTQVQRLMGKLGLSVPQAEARVLAQLSSQERLRAADYRISGEAALEDTRRQVADVWRDLTRRAGRPAGASVSMASANLRRNRGSR
jgi:dephospho-CoA kinase